MTYQDAIQAARAATTYEQADAVCKVIEGAYEAISDRQYYYVRNIAINAAYAAQANEQAAATTTRQAGEMERVW